MIKKPTYNELKKKWHGCIRRTEPLWRSIGGIPLDRDSIVYYSTIAASIEPFVPYRVLGVCLGCAAVIILVAPDASLPDPGKAIFVLVGLVAPFCYGLEP